MYNKSLIPWFRYKPARELIDRAKQVFIDSAEQAGRKLTPMEAESHGIQRYLKVQGCLKDLDWINHLMLYLIFQISFLIEPSLDAATTA